jgi:iodothyronine deiodinase-like protein
MYRSYRDRASLVFVYVAEAHATDGWQMDSNVEENVLIANHVTIEDRFDAARASVERLGLTIPVLVDDMEDAVSNAFAAWPERIYVVDRDARIAYAGGPGPFEFDPDAAATALEELL